MDADKIRKFKQLAGQSLPEKIETSDLNKRKLGAQLLLSELIEYIVRGLKITPVYNGQIITDPEAFQYQEIAGEEPDHLEMLDGLADVAYTMFWNSEAFGLPLKPAFNLVCDNNLEKFVKLENWALGEQTYEGQDIDCKRDLKWPSEVVKVEVKNIEGDFFAVGKDKRGKVRKPATYKSVDLVELLKRHQ
jgi:hypothetical protein